MGIDYSARMEDGLLVVTSVGFDENIEQARDYGMWVIGEALRQGATRILCDERALEYRLSTIDTFQIASDIADAAPRLAQVALVCNPQYIDDATFWENVAVNRGLTVKVFKELEAALHWLGA